MSTNRKKVCFIFGTRPEAIKVAPVIRAFEADGGFDVTSVSSGQHRELLHQTLRVFDLETDHDLDIMTTQQSPNTVAGELFRRLDPLLAEIAPDVVLVQGDTTTAFVGAVSAFQRRIPVGHIEAGLRSGNMQSPFPEEFNRCAIAHVADFHFCPTERAREALRSERVPEERLFLTGNTSIDALHWVIKNSSPAERVADGRVRILLTAHRRENFGERHQRIFQALAQWIEAHPQVDFLYTLHPNPQVRAAAESIFSGKDRITLLPAQDYVAFAGLMAGVDLIVTDSGGVQEEAPALKKPVLVIREETERPEAIEAGVAELVGTDPDRLISALNRLLDDRAHYARMASGGSPFGDGHASKRIVDAIKARLFQS